MRASDLLQLGGEALSDDRDEEWADGQLFLPDGNRGGDNKKGGGKGGGGGAIVDVRLAETGCCAWESGMVVAKREREASGKIRPCCRGAGAALVSESQVIIAIMTATKTPDCVPLPRGGMRARALLVVLGSRSVLFSDVQFFLGEGGRERVQANPLLFGTSSP